MKKLFQLLFLFLPLIPFAQTATKAKPASLQKIDTAKIDTLWTHTKNKAGRYKMIRRYFSISGVVSHVGKGIDNNDCDSTFNVTVDSISKHIIDSLVKLDPTILVSLRTDMVHIEIVCAANNNCDKPVECDNFKYPFPQPYVPALNANVVITGSLAIEMHGKYVLEMHPVSEIK